MLRVKETFATWRRPFLPRPRAREAREKGDGGGHELELHGGLSCRKGVELLCRGEARRSLGLTWRRWVVVVVGVEGGSTVSENILQKKGRLYLNRQATLLADSHEGLVLGWNDG
jgi:hypothetical protein